MPTYQYACTECGERLEVVQKFSDDPLTECPACHGRLRKLFSAVGVVFKGSGFYKTDSRASSGTSTSGSSPSGSSTGGSSGGSTSGGEGSGGSSESTTSKGSSTSSSSSSSSGDGSKVA